LSDFSSSLYIELWASLASLLRSYTAAHGLHNNRQAAVEAGEERITVRHEAKWLRLGRNGAIVTWMREDSSSGKMEITEAGRLRNETGEDEMDLIAEAWARELMR
jgi:cell division inhibitor SulA